MRITADHAGDCPTTMGIAGSGMSALARNLFHRGVPRSVIRRCAVTRRIVAP
jgi:hypothetical protein